jgi:hypothetical protein
VAPGQDGDPDLGRQRAEIEDTLHERWVPLQVSVPQVLTERACTQARKTPARGRRAWLDQSIIRAVSGGAQPGDPLPPLQPSPYIRGVTDTEVIITGRGPGRCVAVLFSHQGFPKARFGHRFPLEPFAEDREKIWLMEELDTGALHRMMRDQPAADDAGIIWTTWGNPDPDRQDES